VVGLLVGGSCTNLSAGLTQLEDAVVFAALEQLTTT